MVLLTLFLAAFSTIVLGHQLHQFQGKELLKLTVDQFWSLILILGMALPKIKVRIHVMLFSALGEGSG